MGLPPRAALIGRLVLSTVHANDSFAVTERLFDLGIPRYLVGAVLRGAVSAAGSEDL